MDRAEDAMLVQDKLVSLGASADETSALRGGALDSDGG